MIALSLNAMSFAALSGKSPLAQDNFRSLSFADGKAARL